MSTDGSNELQTIAISTTAPDNSKPERHAGRGRKDRRASGRLMDLREAERYSGISWWTLRDLILSGELPAVRPPRLRRMWVDREDLDQAISRWKVRSG
jgi:hypothetical protein